MKVHCCNSEMFKAVIFYTYPIMKPPIRGSIFAQKYLRKCIDTYFILQNKYIRIYEDSFGGFGAKILRDDCPPNPHHLTWSILTSLLFDNPNSRRALKAFRMILLAGLFFLVSIQILSVDTKKNISELLSCSGFHVNIHD